MKAAKELEAEKQEQRDMAQDMQLMKEKEMQDVCGVFLIIPKHTRFITKNFNIYSLP